MAAIRVGLIGVGWGSIVQVPAFRVVPGFEVVALCSRRADSVAAAGARLDLDDVSTDWEAFVRRDDLDLISVATPVDLHLPQVLAAIAAGKHVLVEKPVGLTAAETAAMVAAAEAAGVQHAVCFENRWAPTQLRIAELARVGAGRRPLPGARPRQRRLLASDPGAAVRVDVPARRGWRLPDGHGFTRHRLHLFAVR